MRLPPRLAALLLAAGTVALGSAARAEEAQPIEVTLKDQTFTPAEIKVPVGETVVVIVRMDSLACIPATW